MQWGSTCCAAFKEELPCINPILPTTACSLLYAIWTAATGLYHLGDPGDNRESLSFYRRIIEAGIETQLTPDERQIIELRYRRGLPAAEASRLLGSIAPTANRRLNRALLRLQQFAKGCVLAVEASEHLFTKCS